MAWVAVQGVVLHIFWAERNGVTLDASRREEVSLRWVARQLARLITLDGRPLEQSPPAVQLQPTRARPTSGAVVSA
jgi:hypothetical protein